MRFYFQRRRSTILLPRIPKLRYNYRVHTSVRTCLIRLERLEITYTTPHELMLSGPLPAFKTLRLAWERLGFRELYETWLNAGATMVQDQLIASVNTHGGWFAIMHPNPAEIDIVEAGTIGREPTERKAWCNEFTAQVLMMDMVMVRETKQPIFQYIVSVERFSHFQLLLPGKGVIYGLRRSAERVQNGNAARLTVDA